ncbi:oligosaccharide flippase family protein [uncultured Alistipes sp.]|uniref:oligosaccharide flippase family protein n=1 Tax=uncultured Alistipes sp. TaxID=538949 RepID=UPI00266C2B11|nr:oligosaccharide flippase family protein [uncultured Alistipes sp.]
MPSIKINFLYKSALTVSTYVIGFITFPYITRVLGVENIGIVNYIDNLTNYFLLFATMGISILGVREISSAGQNNKLRNKVFSNILGLNLIFTFIILAIYLLSVEFIVELQPYKELLYIGIGKIFFTVLLVEWLYTGLEEFRYIAIRSIAIKLLYVVAVFILIKSPEDYKLYFALTVGTIILNAIINIFYALRFIHINIYDLLSIRYLKENFTLGSYLILNSMYSTFNVVFLGLTTNNIQVGYYTTAFKLGTVV